MMHQKATRLGTEVLSISGRRLFIGLLPALAAGGLLTIALMASGPVHLIPGVWLVLYGVAVMQAGAFSVKTVPSMGARVCSVRRHDVAFTVAVGQRHASGRLWRVTHYLRVHHCEETRWVGTPSIRKDSDRLGDIGLQPGGREAPRPSASIPSSMSACGWGLSARSRSTTRSASTT